MVHRCVAAYSEACRVGYVEEGLRGVGETLVGVLGAGCQGDGWAAGGGVRDWCVGFCVGFGRIRVGSWRFSAYGKVEHVGPCVGNRGHTLIYQERK